MPAILKAVHVCYHSADLDGLMSGAIMKFFIEQNGFKLFPAIKTVVMHPWDYGDPVPAIPEDGFIVMVDITIPELIDRPNLLWIDHHIGSIREHSNKFKIQLQNESATIFGQSGSCRMAYLIDGVAACRLAYQFCMNNITDMPKHAAYIDREVREPRLVNLLGEFDVWDKRNPDAEVLQYGMVGTTVDDLVNYLGTKGSLYMSEFEHKRLGNGHVAQEYMKAYNADLASRNAYRVRWEGMNVLALNHSRGNSITFDSLDQEGIDALCLWRYDGRNIKVSLYQPKQGSEFDMSVVAKKYQGGGHRAAAGFELNPAMLKDIAQDLIFPD